MTVGTLRDDLLLMAVFMLIGFFVREKVKLFQKLFLPSSLIGGLFLLILGQQGIHVVTVPESFSKLPGALTGIVLTSLVFGVTINKEKIRSYLDYSFITMTTYGMQMGLGVLLGTVFQKSGKAFQMAGVLWESLLFMVDMGQPQQREQNLKNMGFPRTWQLEWYFPHLA